MQIHTLAENVSLSVFETKKFNSVTMTFSFIMPASNYTNTGNNIAAGILFEGCEEYRTAAKIYRRLEEMGAEGYSSVVKKGDYSILAVCFKFRAEYIKEMISLAGNIIFKPLFKPNAVANSRKAMLDRIKAERNDKRAYAKQRLIECAFSGQPFGSDGNGSEKFINMDIREYYRSLLTKSRIEITLAGNVNIEKMISIFNEKIPFEPRTFAPVNDCKKDSTFKEYSEKADIEQSKLCIGVNAEFDCWEKAAAANCILGGGAGSVLFNNVREKNGLCYYIVSSLYRYKKYIVIESGIDAEEKENVIKSVEQALKSFYPSREELEKAKSSLVSSLRAAEDSQSKLTDFYIGQLLAGDNRGIEELTESILSLTDVNNAFEKLEIDTVFCLEQAGKF